MVLSAGTRLGPYEILALLGAGGMGEVYKARDTRLDRTVAIKVLPPHFAADPRAAASGSSARRRRISQLNHPHICTLYDVGQRRTGPRLPGHGVSRGRDARRRAEHAARCRSTEALRSPSQIADALDKAHRRGHRPSRSQAGNIMLTKAGAKLLDFGLAKVSAPAPCSARGADAADAAHELDGAGQRSSARSSTWRPSSSKGRRPTRGPTSSPSAPSSTRCSPAKGFQGTSQARLLGAILKDDPLPVSRSGTIPPALDSLVQTCLAKDPDDRVQSAHDIWLQLKWIAQSSPDVASPAVGGSGRQRERAMWAAAAMTCAAIAGAATWWLKPADDHSHFAERSQFVPPDNQSFTSAARRGVAISPDGTKLVYAANRQLYLRALDQVDARPIRGTADVSVAQEPMFSPDGEWVAYLAVDSSSVGGQPRMSVKRVAVAGGAPVTLGHVDGLSSGASWRHGVILVGRGPAGIDAIPEGGGAARTVITVDAKTERAVQPTLLDDGRHVLFAIPAPLDTGRESASGEGPIVVQGLNGGPRKVLVDRGTSPHVLPSGQLAYVREGTILGVPFDQARLEVTGTPVPLIEGVAVAGQSSAGQFGISKTGTLVYLPTGYAATSRQLVWVDRQGREQTLGAPAGNYQQPRLSPDGTRAVVSLSANLWIWVFGNDTLVRLTNEPAVQYNPAWTPDGRRVVYDSNDGSGVQILRRTADGTGAAEVIAPRPAGYPEIVSSDQSFLIYHPMERVATLLPLNPKGTARPLFSDVKGQVSDAEISPDRRWIAYESNESGRFEVYVRPFPPEQPGRWQISPNGGQHPLWSRNGRELFFLAVDGMMVSVPVQPGPTFTQGKPSYLFPAGQYYYNVARNYDVSVDGRRFLMIKNTARSENRPAIIVVNHWIDEVRAKMGGKN